MGDDLTLFSPCRIHLLDSNMIAFGKKVPDVRFWPIRIDASLLYEKLMNGFAIAKNNNVGRPKFEGEYRTIFFSPFTESAMMT